MSNLPKVSVIIPVYNAEEFLNESLDSVVSQTLTDMEIICVDDGSTDKSLEILRDYAQKDARFQILKQRNQYAGVARNNGLAVATGEYVYFFDCDDILKQDSLEKLYTVMVKHQLDVVRGKNTAFDSVSGEKVKQDYYDLAQIPDNKFNVILNSTEHLRYLLKCPVAPWAGMCRRSFLNEHNILFPNFICANDRAFYIHTILVASRIMITDICIQNHRVNNIDSLVGQRQNNFDCQFLSYYAIEELCNLLCVKKDLAILVMEDQLRDLMVWLESFVYSPLHSQLLCRTHAFLNSMNVVYWGQKERISVWRNFSKRLKDAQINEHVKITVVIPIYNTSSYLSECLESILNQTLKNIEIICVDDGSTDSTLAILQEYKRKDGRIRVLRQKNQGAGPARNLGIRLATGEYIAFMDGDDFYPDTSILSDLYDNAKKSGCAIVGGSFSSLKNEEIVTEYTGRNAAYTFHSDGEIQYEDYQYDFGYHRFIYSSKLLLENNVFFPPYWRYQDPPFFTHAMVCAKQFYAMKRITYRYRESYKAVTWNKRNMLSLLNGITDVLELSKKHGLKTLHETTYWRLIRDYYKSKYSPFVLGETVDLDVVRILLRANSAIDLNLIEKTCTAKYYVPILEELEIKKKTTIAALLKVQQDLPDILLDDTNKTPLVSVVVPVYNVERYLKECLDSLVNQTLRNIEIICVNDGSPDNSLAILEEYKASDSRIQVISQKNQGLSGARNTGLKHAIGKYIYFMDSDDWLDLEALENLTTLAEKDRLDVVFFDALSFYDSPQLEKQFPQYQSSYSYNRKEEFGEIYTGQVLMAKFQNNHSYRTAVWIQFINREFLNREELSFYPGIYHEDNLFTYCLLMHAQRVTHRTWCYFHRRVREDSIMTRPVSYKNFEGYVISYMKMAIDSTKIENSDIFDCGAKKDLQRVKKTTLDTYNKLFRYPKDSQMSEILDMLEALLFHRMNHPENVQMSKPNINGVSSEEKFNDSYYRQELLAVRKSMSYRIGRAMTFVPRVFRGGYRCFHDNGFIYTVERIQTKLKNFFKR